MFNPFFKIMRSIRFALRGLLEAFSVDQSFLLEVVLGLPIFVILYVWLSPLSSVEVLALWGAYMLILIVELVNTALEKALDHLHPERHDNIAAAKDIAAAAVFLSFLHAGIVVCFLFWDRLV